VIVAVVVLALAGIGAWWLTTHQSMQGDSDQTLAESAYANALKNADAVGERVMNEFRGKPVHNRTLVTPGEYAAILKAAKSKSTTAERNRALAAMEGEYAAVVDAEVVDIVGGEASAVLFSVLTDSDGLYWSGRQIRVAIDRSQERVYSRGSRWKLHLSVNLGGNAFGFGDVLGSDDAKIAGRR